MPIIVFLGPPPQTLAMPVLAATSSLDVPTTVLRTGEGVVVVVDGGDESVGRNYIPYIAPEELGGRITYLTEILLPGGQTTVCALETAIPLEITEELNQTGSARVMLASNDPNAGEALVGEREIRIWRHGVIIFWGVIVRYEDDFKTITLQCMDLTWYYHRRYFGRAGRQNYFENHSFEQGLVGWLTGFQPVLETNPVAGPIEVRTDNRIVGQRALYMRTSPGNPARLGMLAWQFQEWTVNAGPTTNPYRGDTWTATAWCYVVGSEWEGPNDARIGMEIIRLSTTEVVTIDGTDYPKILQQKMVPIDATTPRDKWIRMEAELDIPYRGEPEMIQVILRTPHGGVYWDEVTLTWDEQTSWWNTEQAVSFRGIAEHAQDPAYDKSDFNIDVFAPDTGIIRPEVIHHHHDHENILDALREYTVLKDGFDMSIVVTPTTRTLRAWYPRKGARKPELALEYGRNLTSCKLIRDGERVANSITVLAEGEGSDREEGGAIDTSILDGGLTLEKVYHATPGTGVDSLQQQADRGLARFKTPMDALEVSTNEAATAFISNLTVGDIVPVTVRVNHIDIQADYRVHKIVIDPKTESLTLTINPMTEEFL